MLIALTSLASAVSIAGLDCSSGAYTLSTCEAVNEMGASINSQYGTTVVDEGSANSRLTFTWLYEQLEDMRVSTLESGSCRTDGAFQGWHAGLYDGNGWSGMVDFGLPSSGTLDRTLHLASGVVEGVTVPMIGDRASSYNAKQVWLNTFNATDWDAGVFVRIQGRKGLYATLYGPCDAGIDPQVGFEDWYTGDLSAAQGRCTELSWDFDDGTLQGWTVEQGSIGVSDGTGDIAYSAPYYLRHQPFGSRDTFHTTSLVRSPFFTIHPDHTISAQMNGGRAEGTSNATSTPGSFADLAGDTNGATPGIHQMGVALALADDGWAAILQSTLNQTDVFELNTFDPATIAALAGQPVRLDFYDSFQGSWGWTGIDDVALTCP
ncbi:MAG: hypothetical protein H6736_12570 [Alphaproteobacteria bacterium]|nr:hypothetical protein [Alphaproteobacteria bacterium]